jgi:biopolymer transport protein ExbB/TolQ
MNNVMKALVLTAPAAAVLFFYVIIKQSEHEALIERESARFDNLFSEIAKSKLLPGSNNTFFESIQERAKKEEEEAQKRLEEKRKKAEEIQRELEKTLNETKKEELEKHLK